MAGPHSTTRSRRRATVSDRSVPSGGGVALLLIDNVPLQQAAWTEFHAARKRLEKTSADLHRHEQVDVPAYETWMHQTFPILISTLRQLHQEVFLKERQIQSVQAMAGMTGESERSLWKELKEQEANPEAHRERADGDGTDDEDDVDDDPWSSDDADDFFEDEARPRGKRKEGQSRADDPFDFDLFGRLEGKSPLPTDDAKEIYRRLVQRLHPDRGGEWTSVRQRLWHEVQQAWAQRDADWLARLEIEWETANDVLGPTSPLSRLRRAIKDLHAARRDIERKLRDYRGDPQWKFTSTEKKRWKLHAQLEENFEHDLFVLKKQLAYLDSIIAEWERPRRSARHKQAAARPGKRKSNSAKKRRSWSTDIGEW